MKKIGIVPAAKLDAVENIWDNKKVTYDNIW